MQNNTMEEDFFRRVQSITSESYYEDERTREIFRNGFNEALGMVHIELFGTPKSQGFLKEQIHLAEQSLVQRVREEIRSHGSEFWDDEDHAVGGYISKEALMTLPSLSTPKPKGDE